MEKRNRTDYNKKYWLANKEILKEKQKQYYYANHEKFKELARERWYKNSQKYKDAKNEYYKQNSEKIKEQARKAWQNIKLKVFEYYSKGTKKCACCGENHIQLLTLDHIYNDGAEHRKKNRFDCIQTYKWIIKNNFPDGFQILCYNCNIGKYKNGGICPHMENSK